MRRALLLLLISAFVFAIPALADSTFQGTVYYTNYCCQNYNVGSVTFFYDATTHVATLGPQTVIASVNGADGIIFAPNGNLLIGGQGNPFVHEITTSGTFVKDYSTAGQQTYHLALSPDGSTLYTSNFGGALVSINLASSAVSVNGTPGTWTGGVTQLAFDGSGNAFYVDGFPNGGGQVGSLDLNTFTGTPLFGPGVAPAHGLVYDPFTGLMTMFGAGFTGTFNPNGTNLLVGGPFSCDFDQGSVDGLGHALVAGCGGITFIDYSGSHDITHPDYVTFFGGFGGIDDVAPLVGPGSQQNAVPEPTTIAMLGTGLAGLITRLRRKL